MVFSGLTMCDLRRAMFWLLAVLAVWDAPRVRT